MNRRQMTVWSWLIGTLAVLCLGLSGCKPTTQAHALNESAAAAQAPGDVQAVNTDSVNYMHDRGVSYTLYDLSTNPPAAIGGSTVYMLDSGGAQACCLNLPAVWRPGLKVRLEWNETDRKTSYETRTKDLEIPRYERPANVYVVFYPGHEVEVVASEGEPGHPAWKGRIKETPWDLCVAQHGRKLCKAATARLFDTVSNQGICTYMKEKGSPDAEDNCAWTLHECMTDYEDERYCKDLIWGAYKK